jgi:hypothetical protein
MKRRVSLPSVKNGPGGAGSGAWCSGLLHGVSRVGTLEPDSIVVEIFACTDEGVEVGVAVELIAKASTEQDDAIGSGRALSLKRRALEQVFDDVFEDGVHLSVEEDSKGKARLAELDFEGFDVLVHHQSISL